MAFLNKLRVNGTDYDIKSSITYTDKTVSSWAAVASNESDYFEDYPFRGTISCSGTTANHIPMVVFAPQDVDSGNYASVATSGANVVYVYGTQSGLQPTILNVICIR